MLKRRRFISATCKRFCTLATLFCVWGWTMQILRTQSSSYKKQHLSIPTVVRLLPKTLAPSLAHHFMRDGHTWLWHHVRGVLARFQVLCRLPVPLWHSGRSWLRIFLWPHLYHSATLAR